MAPLTRLYLAFSRVSGPLWWLSHRRRLKAGKELPDRLAEKYGVYKKARPKGLVIWFHALSVGESLALVPLIEKALQDLPGAHVVLTSSTVTSVQALRQARLPEGCLHVFQPIDTPRATRRFLDHWRPDLAGFAELDFWPRLMMETHRRAIPMVLLNSRMPEGNFARRRKIAGTTGDILRLFQKLLVQDEASKSRFTALGARAERIEVLGALKSAARPLPADATALAGLQKAIGQRPLWLAAATFGTEHAAMVETQEQVLRTLPEALLILAPRHLGDADAAETLLQEAGLTVARRSRGTEITPEIQVFLADTMGEMGLWYRLAPVSFIGHSLTADLEGKNPFEAAALGSAILHGPYMSYFAESYAGLTEEGGARAVEGTKDLAEAIIALQSEAPRKAMTEGARRAVAKRQDVLVKTWDAIRDMLPASSHRH